MSRSSQCAYLVTAVIAALLIASCSQDEEVRGYFEYYTETATINGYSGEDYPVNANHIMYVPGTAACSLDFSINNPRNYTVIPSITFLSQMDASDATAVTVAQDGRNTLTVSLPQSVLRKYECGGDVSFTVRMNEAETRRPFPSYTFHIRCNSAPYITGAALCSDGAHYVVCFNLPPADEMNLSGAQRDIVRLKAGEASADVTVDRNGGFTLSGAGFTASAPGGLRALPGKTAFSTTNRSVYFVTGDAASGQKEYTIEVIDALGLTGSAQVSAQMRKLGNVTIKDATGHTVTPLQEVNLAVGAQTASFTVTPPAGAGVHYNVYSVSAGGVETLDSAKSGQVASGAAVIALGKGKWKISAWAVQSMWTDGDVAAVTFTVKEAASSVTGNVTVDLPQNYTAAFTVPQNVTRGNSLAVSVAVTDAKGDACTVRSMELLLQDRGTEVTSVSGSTGSASIPVLGTWPAQEYTLYVGVVLSNGYSFSKMFYVTVQ